MRFVDDDVLPADLLQARLFTLADLVGSDANVERLSEDRFLYQRSLYPKESKISAGPISVSFDAPFLPWSLSA